MSLTNDEVDRLAEILAAAGEVRGRLRSREGEFIDDVTARYDEQGADLHLTPAQWRWLEDIYAKI